MIKAGELKEGNLILTGYKMGDSARVRSIVTSVHSDYVIVLGERKVNLEDCDGLPIKLMLPNYVGDLTYYHEFQNKTGW